MTFEEFNNAVQEIGTCEDDVQRRTLLANLSQNAQSDYDSITNLTAENEQLRADNETLRSANMDLFLQVGRTVEGNDPPPPNDPVHTKKEFKDLFDEKGGLK